jgi:hypothetical protein
VIFAWCGVAAGAAGEPASAPTVVAAIPTPMPSNVLRFIRSPYVMV